MFQMTKRRYGYAGFADVGVRNLQNGRMKLTLNVEAGQDEAGHRKDINDNYFPIRAIFSGLDVMIVEFPQRAKPFYNGASPVHDFMTLVR